MEKNTANLIVKIIAIIGFIGCAFTILAGVGIVIFGVVGAAILEAIIQAVVPDVVYGLVGSILSILAITAGVIMIIIAVALIFVYKGLMNLKGWARITVLVLSILSLVGSIFSFPASILSMAINGFTVWAMLAKDIKALPWK